MKIAYTTTFDATDVHNWSGTPFYMSQAFNQQGMSVEYIGSLQRKLPPLFKPQQIFNKWIRGRRLSPRYNLHAAKYYSQQVAERLKTLSVDAIVSPLVNPIAYLETKKPLVLWTDALYAGLLGFYSPFAMHSAHTVAEANTLTSACLAHCSLAIFCSDWAANTALEIYGAPRDKVKVVPFGANIETYPDFDTVKTMIAKRDTRKIKLLFLAKSWERKGGDIVLAVAQQLHQAGHAVELTIVGYNPPELQNPPSFIRCLGYISKNTVEGKKRIRELLAESHFLFVPSRAEAYGIVFCEANAFGVPCLTTYVGGISTVVKDHVNGMTFSLYASVQEYCDYIVKTMAATQYQAFALSAYHEFTSRLNWKVAVETVQKLIRDV